MTGLPARLVRLSTRAVLALWWGGLTFYALVVVPIGAEVLGNHTEQGFITQRVSQWLNALGALAAVLTLPGAIRRRATLVRLAWLLMAAAQGMLFVLHPWLDRYLDARAHEVLEAGAFYALHRGYLLVTAVQWVGVSLLLWLGADADRAPDAGATGKPGPTPG